ncbi:MAG: bifunctional hydroxymethylpyrimidine kinase/phosphomethylpyrimidine kinase [Lachnospiraceae bacterium]|nr:bifunctional hydroxymethylpyrimidine kinase/phosphomethylpyrimidine kinase [Lachnospiraceae bacterium]
MNTVLTIAGSDCSGGAGIQADIKTITAHKLYAMSAVTALTAQNTTGVYGILESTPEFLKSQLDCIFQDIFPDAVKIGMVSNVALIRVIAGALRDYKAKNIVMDPVMVSTSGCKLMADDAAAVLIQELMPLSAVITPNIPEAEALSGLTIRGPEDMVAAAERIAGSYAGAILVKGGHETNTANDLLYANGEVRWFCGERIDTPNTHGTGCTLSSAIASNLALGRDLPESVKNAKEYISGALRARLDLGKGSGPLEHTFWLDIQG